MAVKKATLERINITCVNQNVKKFSRAIGLVYDRKLSKNGITVNQFTILSYIHYNDTIALGRLSTQLGMDRTTLTKNLKPLFREGYVETCGSEDKRVKNLCLSTSGVAVLEGSVALWKEAQSEIYQLYGKKQVHHLVRLLNRLTEFDRDV